MVWGSCRTINPSRCATPAGTPATGEKRRHHELQKRRDARAAELEIDPTLIASRATLSDLAHDWEKNQEQLMNWQRELLKG